MSSRPWDRASALPVPIDGRRRPELVSLPAGLPSVPDLFTFMRDAEARFETLRMRVEEVVLATQGEQRAIIETFIRHPADAKVITSEPARGVARNYEVWISDGESVRTYSAPHRVGTSRPLRRPPVGLDDPDLPGVAAVYRPLTALPSETLPDVFVHPAGFCQNTLATGECRVAGAEIVAGREAIVLECDHPRAVQVSADRPDHRLTIAVDRETGVIVRLVEQIGGVATRDAEVVSLEPNATLPPSTFEFEFPSGTTMIF
ncbi:MAG TPA: hypothetical protein VIV06_08205 [Candidatus Limnocylindrales bacterium]